MAIHHPRHLFLIITDPPCPSPLSLQADLEMVQQPKQLSVEPTMLFRLRTLWLFTRSDLKTIVGPVTCFGLCNAIAMDVSLSNSDAATTALSILPRLPATFLWVWTNLLPFSMNNQSQQCSIVEDRINKPWRPIPSGRISMREAK